MIIEEVGKQQFTNTECQRKPLSPFVRTKEDSQTDLPEIVDTWLLLQGRLGDCSESLSTILHLFPSTEQCWNDCQPYTSCLFAPASLKVSLKAFVLWKCIYHCTYANMAILMWFPATQTGQRKKFWLEWVFCSPESKLCLLFIPN